MNMLSQHVSSPIPFHTDDLVKYGLEIDAPSVKCPVPTRSS